MVLNQWVRQYASVVEILKVKSLFTAVMVTENLFSSFSVAHVSGILALTRKPGWAESLKVIRRSW